MKRAYLLVYNDSFGTRDLVKGWLNEMREVITWRYEIPNSFYIISEQEANDISKVLQVKCRGKGMYLVSEVTQNCQGLLPAESWYLLNNKIHKPKSPSS